MCDCLNNIPYASVVGCIFCIVGAGVMGGTLWEALQLTDENIFQKLFVVNLEWVMYVRIGVVSICAFVALLAIFLIIFGYLATKATRQHLYHEDVCTMGGRCTACCCLTIIYLLSIVWVILFAISCLPVVGWYGLSNLCSHEIAKFHRGGNYTFNLENYGIYAPMLPSGARYNLTNRQELESLCQWINYTGPLYISSLGGTLLVIFGLWLTISAIASLRLRLKLAKELVAAKQGFETNEENGEELQSFLVQNARVSAGYQQQPALQNPQLTEDGASSQQFAAQPSPAQFDTTANATRYMDLTHASSSQFDRSKAASPSVVAPGATQFDARTNSKNGTLQFDQRSVQQSQFDRISMQQQAQAQFDQRGMLQQPQFDQRSIQQYDTRSQQQYAAAAAYAQQQMPGSQSGSMGGGTGSQLNMHPSNMAHHQAMINAVGNNQMGMINAANYYASLSRGAANAGRPDVPMQGGTLPSYTAAVHGGYVQANANVQMGMHDANAYQLAGNDMNATGASIDEEDVDADWNMQMNVNMMKH